MKKLCGNEKNIIVTIIPMPTIDAAYKQEKLMIESMQPLANTQLKQHKEKKTMKLDLTLKGLTNGFEYNPESGYINLSLVIDAANAIRKNKGLNVMRQSQVFKSKRFTESLDLVTRDVRKGHYDSYFKITPCSTEILSPTDAAFTYRCFLPLAVEVAAMMSVKVQRQALRSQIKCMTARKPKTDHYPALSIIIRELLCVSRSESIQDITDTVTNIIDTAILHTDQKWNDGNVSAKQALKKVDIEQRLCDYIQSGLIVNANALYNAAHTITR
jgi:hypothetical protein